MKINQIKISGFKSISGLDLQQVSPFSIIAGANGAGKSNFFDALKFVGMTVSVGSEEAIRHFNGYEHLHCFKKRKTRARTFEFLIDVELSNKQNKYHLKIFDMHKNPSIQESLTVDGVMVLDRKRGEAPSLRMGEDSEELYKGSFEFQVGIY